MVRKLHNFDDWIDYFKYWQDSIGLPQGDLRKYGFEAKFGDPEVPHIEFGHYKGQRKWPTVMHIPDQRIRDALLNLIVYQGDTRSEERRVGKECRCRWKPYPKKKNNINIIEIGRT